MYRRRHVAGAADVQLVAYTSVLAAARANYSIGRDHLATEGILIASGVPYLLLRNGWYNENYTGHLDAILHYGQVFGCAGDGRVATAARADYGEAAAIVMTEVDRPRQIYELSGDTAFTLTELAAERSVAEPAETSATPSCPRRNIRRSWSAKASPTPTPPNSSKPTQPSRRANWPIHQVSFGA